MFAGRLRNWMAITAYGIFKINKDSREIAYYNVKWVYVVQDRVE
jgi:hypothetical protein